jgi:glucose-6-phosphate isomerase
MALRFHQQFLFSKEELSSHRPQLDEALAAIRAAKQAGNLGFTKLPYDVEAIAKIKHLAAEVAAEFKTIIVIGTGGADLGTRSVHRALNHQYYNQANTVRGNRPQLYFIGDTTDPITHHELLDVVDLSKSAIIMVSKSGSTIEQMSTFIFLREKLINLVGEEQSRRHIITLADKEQGNLRAITTQEGYRSLVIPADVGDRFSLFSPIGLFPLAIVGIDIDQLVAGAQEADKNEEEPATYAWLQYLAYTLRNQRIQVMMPYTYSLREISLWFRQLWGESLGKEMNRAGEKVHVGPTPVAAIGPTDQHSQVQLYREGPADKTYTFVTVKEPKVNYTLPEAFPNLEGVRYLAGHTFNEILLAEYQSTADALAEVGRPIYTIEMDALDAFHLGYLVMFFELATAVAGELYNINAFDQPGVERGKELMYKALGR